MIHHVSNLPIYFGSNYQPFVSPSSVSASQKRHQRNCPDLGTGDLAIPRIVDASPSIDLGIGEKPSEVLTKFPNPRVAIENTMTIPRTATEETTLRCPAGTAAAVWWNGVHGGHGMLHVHGMHGVHGLRGNQG